MKQELAEALRELFMQARELEAKILNLINEIKEAEREEVAEDERDSPL